jgi:IBR domain, a half RING-finger domain
VKDHSYLRFCPFPGCEQIVSCHGATESSVLTHVPIVTCASSHTFCFGCGMDVDHRPVICPIANMWVKNVTGKDDSGTSQWIQANTKNCPQCKNPTEKNGGCKCVNRLVFDTYRHSFLAHLVVSCAATVNSNGAGCAGKLGASMAIMQRVTLSRRGQRRRLSTRKHRHRRTLRSGYSIMIDTPITSYRPN